MARSQSTFLTTLLVIATIQLLLSGCATMGPSMEEPTVTATDLRVQEIKPLEVVFMLELRVMNPNDFSLDIRGLNCELSIDDQHFATGISDSRQEVPAFGTATVPVMVYASTFDMVGSAIQVIQLIQQQPAAMKPLKYELAGKLRLGATVRKTIPFQSKGELTLSGKNW